MYIICINIFHRTKRMINQSLLKFKILLATSVLIFHKNLYVSIIA
jgi:hypothetical protein